jgi:hypothetical protein
MSLSEILASLSSVSQSATFALPAGHPRDVAAILHAALGVAARLSQTGRTRTQIVDAIRRVADIEDDVAAQDAAAAARIAARFGASDE